MRFLIVVILCFVGMSSCKGCPEARIDKPPIPSEDVFLDVEKPKPGSDGKVDPLEQAKYDVLLYTERAARAEARYEVLQKQKYDDDIRNQIKWITGIALILAGLAIIAAVISPIGKKTFVGIATACGIIAACAQAFKEAVPYLPWIGGALIIAGGVWAAFNWKRLATTARAASDHGDRLEDWLREDVFPTLDDKGRELLEKTIAGVKDESKKQAERLGVHNPLQYLRGKKPSLWKRLFGA